MAQAQTVDLPKRWPLVVLPSNRDNTANKDAKLVNGYLEKTVDGNYDVYKRPGYSSEPGQGGLLYTTSGTALGFYFSSHEGLLAIIGNVLYVGLAAVGTVDTSGYYAFTEIQGATPRVVFTNGHTSYSYSSGSGLVAMTGSQPPGFAVTARPGFVYLDGTLYYITFDAKLYGSGINDPNHWDPLNLILVQIDPSVGVSVAKHLTYVVAFKQWETEIFHDAGNAVGSPLAPDQGSKISWGCINSRSILDIDGELFWLGASKTGSASILRLSNLQMSIVSTPQIERLIYPGDDSLTSDVFAWYYKDAGHKFYVLTIVTKNITLAYDINQGFWSQWTDTNGNYLPIAFSQAYGDFQLLLHMTSGQAYGMNQTLVTDDGAKIVFDLYTPNFDGEVDRKKNLNMLRFNADQTAGSVLQVRCNDYDYAAGKWTNFRRVDLGKQRPFLSGCGSFYRRAYHLRHEAATPLRLMSIDLQIDLGTL